MRSTRRVGRRLSMRRARPCLLPTPRTSEPSESACSPGQRYCDAFILDAALARHGNQFNEALNLFLARRGGGSPSHQASLEANCRYLCCPCWTEGRPSISSLGGYLSPRCKIRVSSFLKHRITTQHGRLLPDKTSPSGIAGRCDYGWPHQIARPICSITEAPGVSQGCYVSFPRLRTCRRMSSCARGWSRGWTR